MKGIIRAGVIAAIVMAVGSYAVSAQTATLQGKIWNLTQMNGKKVEGTRTFLEFEADGKSVTGNAGCNRMFGGVTMGRQTMRFSGIGTTRMFCDELMDSETGFLNALKKVTRYRVSGGKLTLFAGKRAVLRFAGSKPGGDDAPEPQKFRLEDRKWILESVKGRSVDGIKETAFINFDAEKRSAGGNTSCNAFGGSYEASAGNKIRIFDTFSTMRACIEDDRMSIERDMLDALRRANRYKILNDRLELFNDSMLLLAAFVGKAK